MKATHFKYMEWRDTKGLHEDTLHSISDLKFLKDELAFLQDLVAEHTLELLYGSSSEEGKVIFSQLKDHMETLENLLNLLSTHRNHLQVLMDDVDVPGELRTYKDVHYKLMMEEINFHAAVKKTKRAIFKLLAEFMRKSKQKRLQ